MSEYRLQIQYDVDRPIELSALSCGFAGVARQYANFVRGRTSVELAEEEVVLYVTKIESNCILTELAPYAAAGLITIQAIDWHNTLREFAASLHVYFEYFRSIGVSRTDMFGKRDAQDFRAFLGVVAENGHGEINTEVVHYDSSTGKKTSSLKYTYKPTEVSEAFQGVSDYLNKLKSLENNIHEKVLLYLPQLNVDLHKSVGRTADKGIIEAISPKPLPVYWLSEMDSKRVKNQTGVNPHQVSYIVDVKVQTKKEIPQAYSVVKLHDIIPDEPES